MASRIGILSQPHVEKESSHKKQTYEILSPQALKRSQKEFKLICEAAEKLSDASSSSTNT